MIKNLNHHLSGELSDMVIVRKEPASEQRKRSSPLEKCSFACHLFLFPIGLVYLSWLLVPDYILTTPEVETYYPNKDYALHVPVTALFLFLSAPFLYAAFNSLTVPDLDSLDAVGDIYTKSCTTKISSNELLSPGRSLPEISDMDPATLVWYSHNDKHTHQRAS